MGGNLGCCLTFATTNNSAVYGYHIFKYKNTCKIHFRVELLSVRFYIK